MYTIWGQVRLPGFAGDNGIFGNSTDTDRVYHPKQKTETREVGGKLGEVGVRSLLLPFWKMSKVKTPNSHQAPIATIIVLDMSPYKDSHCKYS